VHGIFEKFIRNVKSKHWTRWLGVENRCVAPFNSFSEFNKAEGGDIWFALDDARPIACFAGTGPPDQVLKLPRPLPDGTLKMVARGVKEDPAGSATRPTTNRQVRQLLQIN
jgi:hypothetical protein